MADGLLCVAYCVAIRGVAAATTQCRDGSKCASFRVIGFRLRLCSCEGIEKRRGQDALAPYVDNCLFVRQKKDCGS